MKTSRRTFARAAVAMGVACALSAQAAERVRWDFELPTLEGDRFVQASKLTGFALVNFWGRDCPPCVAELPLLQTTARTQPDLTLLLVATDPPQQARQFLLQHDISLPVVRAGPNVVPLMRQAGNRSGGLPFTVALRDGRICSVHEGVLSKADVQALRAACSEPDEGPSSSR